MFKQLTALITLLAVSSLANAIPLATSFTYQGELQVSGAPANGNYDFQFELFDELSGGGLVGTAVLIENATVTDGVFSVELDFGAGPFAGDQLWLEIGVRDGASAGGYTGLAPRQKLTLTPYALHAEFVAAGTVGDQEINPTQVQQRVSGSCAAGSFVTAVNQNGTVICANDDTGLSSVTGAEIVDSTITGVDLAAGAVMAREIAADAVGASELAADSVGSGEVINNSLTAADLAANSVGSSELANGSVGSLDINASQVQRRVSGLCPSGQYLRGINQNGTVLCETVPKDQVIATVDDPANSVGRYTSIAIGSDNLPVISYYDDTGLGTLKVAHCNDVACSGNDETITTVDDPANEVGLYTSIAIGSDNLPVISYYDKTADALKVAHCNDVACSGNDETITTVDSSANIVGHYTSIAIGSDNLPVISYYDFTAGALKVAHCNDVACNGNDETITTVDDPANNVGSFASISIGSDNLPVISYYDFTANALKVVHCNDVACSGGDETITTVDDPANDVGFYTSIAIGSDNLPVISYYDKTADALKVAHCNDVACSGGDETITTVDDPANNVGQYTSIAIGSDNLPVISYYDVTAGALKVARCNDVACSGNDETITTVDDPANDVGQYTSIAIGSDNLPVISYRDFTAFALKVVRCGTADCTL